VTLPEAASLATPGGNGAIGAARETPTPAVKMKAATAIANAIRIILSSYARTRVCQRGNTEASSQFHDATFSKILMNELSDSFAGNEQTVIDGDLKKIALSGINNLPPAPPWRLDACS
jgi:hypothetical protein